MTQPSEDLRREFGDLDIYLFDQLHCGRIVQGMTVLDAGCGGGRNLACLLRRGFDVWGTDRDDGVRRRHLRLVEQLGIIPTVWHPSDG